MGRRTLSIVSTVGGPALGMTAGLIGDLCFDDPNKAELENLKLKTCCNDIRLKVMGLQVAKNTIAIANLEKEVVQLGDDLALIAEVLATDIETVNTRVNNLETLIEG